ncbi:MAG TPA: exonuclease domain-containing protein [Erysipelotrichaceae bacterium]|nr:exonuclease domain-containing protein [Erysipelotrichaceae bacterium]
MKKFNRLLKGHKSLVFLDFEGTQFSHEMIAIGALHATIDSRGFIKKTKKPFKIYVKPHNRVGKFVTDLTGITDDMLKEKGVSFQTAMNDLKKYCGLSFKKSSFITFGNHDMRILSSSASYSFDFPKDIVQNIQKNYIDFSAFINEFMKDEKGNSLSLVKYCEAFGVKEAGPAHDPAVDAQNLAWLYDASMRNTNLLMEEYKKVLRNFNHFPEPVSKMVRKLADGEDVTYLEFEDSLKKYLA